MKKESFILYNSFYEPIKTLKNEQLGKLFRAIFNYTMNGEITQDTEIMIAFMFIKNQIDIDTKKWEEEKKGRSEAGKKGMASRWGKKKMEDNNYNSDITNYNEDNSVINTITNVTSITDNVNENENENENDNGDVNVINNAPITLNELIEYGKTINASEQYCEKFYNTYESTNWINKNGQKITNAKSLLKKWINEDKSKLNNPEWFNKDIDQNITTLEEQQNFEEKLESLRKGSI